jgi:RHH-type proline utilization regulon transcriptional repressor/proline dehydrogenase/delta 1-pyrroline-5-carboxylate dehydrogenase
MALFRRSAKAASHAPARTTTAPVASASDDARIKAIGAELLERARKEKGSFLSAAFWSDKLMEWSMKDQAFKVQLFRFVDAFPVLRHDADMVHEHLVDYLSQPGVKLPPGMDFGVSAGGLAKGLFTKTMSGQIEGMARKFIAGADAATALPVLEKLWKRSIAFSVDLLGEACVSDEEADHYRDRYLDLVGTLPAAVAPWAPNPLLESDHLGAVPRCNVSVKISALSARVNPMDPDASIRDLMRRIEPILELARDKNVLINFDMESFALKDLTIDLFQRCCQRIDFHAGLAMQAYLKSGDADAARIIDWARASKRTVTVRLVKGAYWDYETIRAEQQGWLSPVWNTKPQTDACFERMAAAFIASTPAKPGESGVKLALGSHNARSIAAAIAALDARGLPRSAIELQMLHGMGEQLKAAAVDMNLRIREYIPVGEMIPGMAYLVRRLLENTSNESWLKAGFFENADIDALLADPARKATVGSNGSAIAKDLCELAPERHALSPAIEGVGDDRAFATEPMRDFAQAEVRRRFAEAIAKAAVPRVASDKTPADAQEAIRIAHEFFPTWRDTDPVRRAQIMVKAADAMRARRDELSGIIIKENGKGWVDADADVTEAIDFLDYYARHAVPLFRRERLGKFIGELDEQWYTPRGVTAVIAPWNFPLAIACGMVSAALVTGNTTILKPAEQTAGIAKVLCDILWAAGVPKQALQFLPAPGETTGAALVRDPRIALIAFTGSKAVGLNIIQAAGLTPEEQPHVKRVVCEMGGKNAIIIDSSADLDEAVLGVRQSAFGFQGQKCSACSRVIVVDPQGPTGPTATAFLRRFVAATRALAIGDPMLPGTDIGPVIDEESRTRIERFIDTARREGNTLELAMTPPPPPSTPGGEVLPTHYVGPHIFSGVKPTDTIAREEIFGPVVAVMHAPTFDAAIDLALAVPYRLTGGVYSRRPAHLELAKQRFRVGNLYLNRPITGALVGRQPFGGSGMSGVGSKAGGRDYLLQFVEPRVSCENTLRRGFAPEL